MFSNESGFPPPQTHTRWIEQTKDEKEKKKESASIYFRNFYPIRPRSKSNEVREDGGNSKGPPSISFFSSQSSLFVFPRRMVPPTSLFIGTKLPFPDPPPKILQFSHCSFRIYPPPFFCASSSIYQHHFKFSPDPFPLLFSHTRNTSWMWDPPRVFPPSCIPPPIPDRPRPVIVMEPNDIIV